MPELKRTSSLPFNTLVNTRLGPMLVNRNDLYVGRSLIDYGEFSEGEASMFRQLVGPGNVVLEAGANIGAHTVLLSHLVGLTGHIVAFEPQRIVFQALCANLALNQCINVSAKQEGLGAEAGLMRLPEVDPRHINNFGGLHLLSEGPGEKIAITTVDALNLTRCDLIKADVEGMETAVIEGARQTIARHHPVLYLENDRPEKSAELIGKVLDLGYRAWWHVTPLFNPDNFRKNMNNLFPGTVSINILCQHQSNGRPVSGLKEIVTPNDHWQ